MTYHPDGKPDTVANEGDGFAEGRSTTHWGETYGERAGRLDRSGLSDAVSY